MVYRYSLLSKKILVYVFVFLCLENSFVGALPEEGMPEASPQIIQKAKQILIHAQKKAGIQEIIRKEGAPLLPAFFHILPEIKLQEKRKIHAIAQAFRTIDHPSTLKWFEKHLAGNRTNPEVALEVLSLLGYPKAISIFIPYLLKKDRKIAESACSSLAVLIQQKPIDSFMEIQYILSQYYDSDLVKKALPRASTKQREEAWINLYGILLDVIASTRLEEGRNFFTQALYNINPFIRYKGIASLRHIGMTSTNMPEILLNFIQKDTGYEPDLVWKEAVLAIGDARCLQSVPLLISLLKIQNQKPYFYTQVHWALKKISGCNFPETPDRWEIWWEQEGKLIENRIEALLQELQNTEIPNRIEIIQKLTDPYYIYFLKPKDYKILMDILLTDLEEEPNKDYALVIIKALGELKNSKSIPVLKSLLQQNDVKMKIVASQSLSKFRDSESLKILHDALSQEEDIQAFRAILASVGIRKSIQSIPIVYNFLSNDRAEIRIAAAEILAQFEDTQHVPILVGMLKDSDDNVKKAAHRSLVLLTRKTYPIQSEEWEKISEEISLKMLEKE